jgi:hypothetical protein
MTLIELVIEKEAHMGLKMNGGSTIHLNELITQNELDVGALFIHISAAAEGRAQFLNQDSYKNIYKSMMPFVTTSKYNKRFSEREIDVYIKYFQIN